MTESDQHPCHARAADDVIAAFSTGMNGLSSDEVICRRERYGLNLLPPPNRPGPVRRFLSQFNSLLIYVLLAAAVITAWLGEWLETSVILGVVLINAAMGFLQEGKAERALESLRATLAPAATVTRDGRRITVPAKEPVPGDLVHLSSGDLAPADLRLVHARSLRMQEAPLTGESLTVEKTDAPVAADAELAERSSMIYSGTLVTSGRGSGVVIATGRETEPGRIGAMLAEIETITTSLLRQIALFDRWLTAAILIIAALAFALGVFVRGHDMAEMFLVAVGIAVAAIPEGLPAVMTITLATDVTRMARRNAVIRRLPAVETLGAVTVICTDKTGTLTRNELLAQTIVKPGRTYTVSGTGYVPEGIFVENGEAVNPRAHPDLEMLLRAGVLCNETSLEQVGAGWRISGDPTDAALLTLRAKAGLILAQEEARCSHCDMIPFEAEHRFMASLHEDEEGGAMRMFKGAPERIIDLCSRERWGRQDMPVDHASWWCRIDALAAEGQRLIGIALRTDVDLASPLSVHHVTAGNFILLGLVELIDPPREEPIAAVARCREAGVRVKMITGDHAATATTIGRSLGIGDGKTALTGRTLGALDDAALAEQAMRVDVCARTAPEHKLRLVAALQRRQEIVAMIGDDVNDAPALKRADVGIAMGLKGTDAAQEAAAMVPADDNFTSIADAVEEGRAVYENLRKTILFVVPTSVGQALLIIVALVIGTALPITPVQILWVNTVTAVTLELALAFQSTEPDVMRRPPRTPRAPILSGVLLGRILWVALVMGCGALVLFLHALGHGVERAVARTIAVNSLVVGQVFYLLSRPRIAASSMTWRGLFENRIALRAIGAVLLLLFIFTDLPLLQWLFDSRPLDLEAWVLMGLFGIALFLLAEAEKVIMRRGAGTGRRHGRPAFRPAP